VDVERLHGPESAKALLKKNGFVVVPELHGRVFGPYGFAHFRERVPPFVTVDSVYRSFHVILEQRLSEVESALARDVAAIGRDMHELLLQRRSAPALTPGRHAAVDLSADYFLVARILIEPRLDREALMRSAGRSEAVSKEVRLIEAAAGVDESPLFGCRMDYSLFRPRSFYRGTEALERHFRALTWYGLAAFRLIDDTETLAAMEIADLFRVHEEVRKRWERIDRLHGFLIGPADDLTPPEYADALVSARVMGVGGTALERFRMVARGLRDPAINAAVLTPEEMPGWKRLTKGMRFLGARHLPGSEAMLGLVWPEVPGRLFPSGLDVMAANGSARARELLKASGVWETPGYAAGAKKVRTVFDKAKAAENPTLFAEALKVAEAITSPPDERVPSFMTTPAYRDRSLEASLVVWASLRHAFQLAPKPTLKGGGICEDPFAGYVEPNAAFFEGMRGLISRAIDVLGAVDGAKTSQLRELGELAEKLAEMVRKELENEQFTEEERRLLHDYGKTIRWLTRPQNYQPWMVYAADVFTDPVLNKCLQVGTGASMPIYVVVPHDGRLHLAKGGVIAYHEFLLPLSDRLTDSRWRHMVSSRTAPGRPEWTRTFVARYDYDADAVLAAVETGVIPKGADTVNDPRLVEALQKGLAPGGAFEGKRDLDAALALYARKAGRLATPLLLTLFEREHAEGRDADFLRWGYARGVAGILQSTVPEHYMDDLLEMVWGGDPKLAERAVWTLSGAAENEADDALIRFLGHPEWSVADAAAQALGRRGRRRATALILARYEDSDARTRAGMLRAAGHLVSQFHGTGGVRFESWLSDEDERGLRDKVAPLALREIADPDEEVSGWAMMLAASIELREAVPLIEKTCEARMNGFAPDALASFGDEGRQALLRLSYTVERQKDGSLWLGVILYTLAGTRAEIAVPRAREFLDRRESVLNEKQLVCDFAAKLLSRVYPDGPETDLPNDGKIAGSKEKIADWEDRDATIKAWRLYLERLPAPPEGAAPGRSD
jgi:hypothetical protein